MIILVSESHLSGLDGADIPAGKSHQKAYAAKGSLHE